MKEKTFNSPESKLLASTVFIYSSDSKLPLVCAEKDGSQFALKGTKKPHKVSRTVNNGAGFDQTTYLSLNNPIYLQYYKSDLYTSWELGYVSFCTC